MGLLYIADLCAVDVRGIMTWCEGGSMSCEGCHPEQDMKQQTEEEEEDGYAADFSACISMAVSNRVEKRGRVA